MSENNVSQSKTLRMGTRGSTLAKKQTEIVRDLIWHSHPGYPITTEIITTKGDIMQQCGLHQIGGQGVFVRELDNAILEGKIDCAVHSMKDIPSFRPPGLTTVAVLLRDPPYDFLAHTCNEQEIQIIGTSSTRRCAQTLRYYREHPIFDIHDITVSPLRGNVDSRLSKLKDGAYDAILLAEAGLVRLGYQIPGQRLEVAAFVPSPNQGTIAVVCRENSPHLSLLSKLHDQQSGIDTAIERVVMEEIGGGCFTPQGIYCKHGDLTAEVLSLDGTQYERIIERVSSLDQAHEIGRELKKRATPLIEAARKELKA
ncbi:MAG: hydroxymethylbilane synthase [Methanomicrobiales archaeon]|nr:hydroxymethylbilane synthase [Methanomicrobiales archaeon]